MQALQRHTVAAAEPVEKTTKAKVSTPDIDTEKIIEDLKTKVRMPSCLLPYRFVVEL
jgi:hypothetical protein